MLPDACPGCRVDLRPGDAEPLCPACRGAARPIERACVLCGVAVDGGARCFRCRTKSLGALNLIRAAVAYESPVPALVHAFKYRGRRRLAAPLAGWMAAAWAERPELKAFDVLVPVPLHAERLKERGFNQSELLARELGARLDLPVEQPLVRARRTSPQARIEDRAAREANLDGAFAAGAAFAGLLEGGRYLLIDDVCTTGATLKACAAALRDAGAEDVGAFVLARQSL